jgi:peptide deformylase
MKVITVNKDKNGALKQTCQLVQDDEIRDVINGMKELLLGAYNGTGKGLAAPQVGVNLRFFILRFGNRIDVFINPVIIKYGEVKVKSQEGCLSVPGAWYEVTRSRKIEVKYFNENMLLCRAKFTGFDAIAFQHERDHLDGILICDKGKLVA